MYIDDGSTDDEEEDLIVNDGLNLVAKEMLEYCIISKDE